VGLAALALCQACARFGFEDVARARPDAGLGSSLINTGSGQADASLPFPLDAGPTPADASATTDAGGLPDAGVVLPDPGDAASDAAASAPVPCSLSSPERLGSPNYAGNDLWSPSLASDGRSLYFAVLVPGWVEQVAVSTRPGSAGAFGEGRALPAPVNTGTEGTPNISADELALYFFSERAGGAGGRDLYVATRASASDDFDTVRELVGLNTPEREHLPRVSADELTLYFVSNRSGNTEIWRAARSTRTADFAGAELVPELNSEGEDGAVTLSPDGLEAILATNRQGTQGGRDLYRATRTATTEPFSTPEPLASLNSGLNDYDPTLSFDGAELYFVSNRNGSDTEVYRSLRSCP
jgi:Tol biopolymer transport system component